MENRFGPIVISFGLTKAWHPQLSPFQAARLKASRHRGPSADYAGSRSASPNALRNI
jgi:hypothetical protein